MKHLIILILLLAIYFGTTLEAKNIAVCMLKGKSTPFKDAVLDSLKTQFSNYKIDIINDVKPKEFQASKYDAVIVVDELEAWTWFNTKLKKLSKQLDPKKTIYFITAGDANWKWKKENVLTVTSASKNDKIIPTWHNLKKQLQNILH